MYDILTYLGVTEQGGLGHESRRTDEVLGGLSQHVREVVHAQHAVAVRQIEQLEDGARQDARTGAAELYEEVLKHTHQILDSVR